ncbi:MAG: PAS domain-containing protein [Bacteroidales bacterium]|nr:PAS domain-containing protein [Bacteroidales bacterium]
MKNDFTAGMKESESSYSQLEIFFDLTSEAMLMTEGDTIELCNNNFASLVGYNTEEIKHSPLLNFIYKDDKDFVLSGIVQQQTSFVKVRLLSKDNQIVWSLFKSQYIQTLNKNILIFKKTEDFPKIQNKLSLVMEAVREGYWDWDMRTGEAFYDEQWYKLLGYSAEDKGPCNTFWEDKVHPADRDYVFQN